MFTQGVLDTHFSQRGRQGRITRLGMETGVDFAIGIDETTALVIEIGEKETNFEVFGYYGASFFDFRQVKENSLDQFASFGVKWSYFTFGDKFTLT